MSYTQTVIDATFSINTDAPVGSFTFGAEDARVKALFHLPVDVGTFTVTEQDNSFIETEVLIAEGGSFTFTGEEAVIIPSITLVAETGSFSFDGQIAGIAQFEDFASASFIFTGVDADLRAGRARRFEFADVANAVTLPQNQANSVIIVDPNNEAA